MIEHEEYIILSAYIIYITKLQGCGTIAPWRYPISIKKKNAGAIIPTITNCESEQVKGSYDFIGVIHYMNINVRDNPDALSIQLRDYNADMAANLICNYSIMFK